MTGAVVVEAPIAGAVPVPIVPVLYQVLPVLLVVALIGALATVLLDRGK